MRSTTYLFGNQDLLSIRYMLLAVFCLLACGDNPQRNDANKKRDLIKAIPGKSDSIPVKLAEKGEVLIAYSDCYTCHKESEKSVGPAFKDIAKRYPVNKVYIEMLAQKIIVGGSGSWGSPIMHPHPKLSFEDAQLMVMYILSMKK